MSNSAVAMQENLSDLEITTSYDVNKLYNF